MSKIEMFGVPPHQIFTHLISSVVSLAQLVSPSVALLAELVNLVVSWAILGCFQAISRVFKGYFKSISM